MIVSFGTPAFQLLLSCNHSNLLDVIALCRRCPNLVELDVSDSSLLTQTSIAVIHENLHRLEYLAMSRCYGVQISAFL